MQKYIVDTNFIVRYLLADNKDHYTQAKAVFDQVRDGKAQVKLEQVVFVEVIFVLSSFYDIPKEKIIDTMHSFLSYKGLDTEKYLLGMALDIYRNHNIHIVDSIIVARSKLDNTPVTVLTFDKKLDKILRTCLHRIV